MHTQKDSPLLTLLPPSKTKSKKTMKKKMERTEMYLIGNYHILLKDFIQQQNKYAYLLSYTL